MPVIVIIVGFGTLNFPVYLVDSTTTTLLGKIPTEQIAEQIDKYCTQYNIYEVLIIGNTDYIKELKTLIQSKNNEIEVQLNEIFN